MILDEFESNDTKEAFINGDFYIKVHGECGWISRSGEAYRRNQSAQPGFQIDALKSTSQQLWASGLPLIGPV